MRPLKLRLEGFTSYRSPVEVDFQDLDLFAITGPTGAGKSSIVHGITYALYGRVPGFGNEVKELISQGSNHLQATLEFAVGDARYIVTRRTVRRGAPRIQLFRIGEDGSTNALTDRARETEQQVQKLLGLDFDGFIRSVLLPQGQFHLFLAGEPRERRKVLAELLRLDIYETIMRAANTEAGRREERADSLRRRLAEDFVDATQENLKEKEKRLRELRSEERKLEAARSALEEAKGAALALAGALGRLASAGDELKRDEEALQAASQTASGGEERFRALESELQGVERELADSPFQPDLHSRLGLARTPAREHQSALSQLTSLKKKLAQQELDTQEAMVQQQAAEQALAGAEEELKRAEGELELLRQRHAAADLRRVLRPGDRCPVCDQPVADPPPAEHVALDEAAARGREARQTAREAASYGEEARRRAALAEQQLHSVHSDIQGAEHDVQRWLGELASLLDTDRPPSREQIEADYEAQEEARKRHEELGRGRQRLETERERLKEEYEKARQSLAGLEARVKAQRSLVEGFEEEVAQARKQLLALARRQGWQDVSAELDRGEKPVALEHRAAQAEAESQSLQQEMGAVKGVIRHIKEGIEQAEQLRREQRDLAEKAQLARELAGLLRADKFQAYVEEAALRVLAEDGSRHLLDVSDRRYEFEVRGQEFLVIDHWSGDETRSVKTLSGGETFLASLALALALAERLPELGALGKSTTLESLFLDEGFSSLDAETRNVVADALERLHLDGTRLVGVITHDRELAERMPSRIVVSKSESGSTASLE